MEVPVWEAGDRACDVRMTSSALIAWRAQVRTLQSELEREIGKVHDGEKMIEKLKAWLEERSAEMAAVREREATAWAQLEAARRQIIEMRAAYESALAVEVGKLEEMTETVQALSTHTQARDVTRAK